MAEGGSKIEVLEDDAQFTCLICGQAGMTELDMRNHIMMDHVDQDISCPFCDLSGITSNEMNLHVNKVHLEEYKSPVRENSCSKLTEEENGKISVNTTLAQKEEKLTLENDIDMQEDGDIKQNISPTVLKENVLQNSPGSDVEEKSSDFEMLEKNSEGNLSQSTSSSSFSMMSASSSSGESPSMPRSKSTNYKSQGSPENCMKRSKLSLDFTSSLQRQSSVDRSCESGSGRDSMQRSGSLSSSERDMASVARNPGIVPDINCNVEPDINCNIPMEFSCPLCQFSTRSEGDIQVHVNHQHVDILSPCNNITRTQTALPGTNQTRHLNTATAQQSFACPFCDVSMPHSDQLQLHVNSKHVDILSPNRARNELQSGTCMSTSNSADFIDIVTCPVCDKEFNNASLLQRHVNGHFSAEPTPVQEKHDQALALEILKTEERERAREKKEFQALQQMYGMSSGTNYKKQYEQNLEKAVARGDLSVTEFHVRKSHLKGRDLHGVDDGHSCTKDIIPHLQDYYKSLIASSVVGHHLCSAVDHYSASYGDKGWGCGYRNFQMLLSSLVTNPTYCKVLFNGKPQIPSLPKIQRLIESAWKKGFDKQGCEQLGGRVVDSTKWIGATEIAATLLSLKVKCRLLDFHNPSAANGTHPRMFEWIKNYFSEASPYKPPIYLQHQGHSRTVVGVEQLKDGNCRLLLFDPSTSKKQMHLFINGFINSNVMRIMRRTVNGLKAKQYQLVAVTGILTDKEYEEHKILKSDRLS